MPIKNILLLFVLSFSLLKNSTASDIYAEYKMTGIGDKVFTSKMFVKDGNMRSEVDMNIAGKEMNMVSLHLASKPEVTIMLNSMTKTYSEVKLSGATKSEADDFSIDVIGEEKVEQYNCTHVRMKSKGNAWDVWLCKDLPNIDFTYEKDDAATNNKIVELMKSKNLKGMPVKMVFYKTGTNTPAMTMLLTKYEARDLDAALFTIPTDYTKNEMDFDPAKMKNMSPEERKAMMQKMMEQYKKH
jgi:hypothetical protein